MKLIRKDDYEILISRLCKPLKKYYKVEKSRVILPMRVTANYDDKTADFESFARPLWAIAGLVVRGDEYWKKTVFSMIRNGIDPDSSEYWGQVRPHDQMIVEMTSIAFFTYINRSIFEEEFSKKEKIKFETWFNQINKISYSENNWQFFGIIINAILLQMNLSGNRDVIKRNWKTIESHYLGDGWYSDGKTRQRDYYISFAYHFYSLLWIYIGNTPADIDKDIKQRANRFARDFMYFFDGNGSSVPYGRSLIYRFAHVAFWSAYLLAGLNEINPGIIKGIINRNIKWWLEKSIFHENGILNVGYAYHNLIMTEFYNATGSAYWAFKSFIVLLLPEDDIYWEAKEMQMPSLDSFYIVKPASFVITRYKQSPTLFPANHQARFEWEHSIAKYEKIAYSSKFAFNISKGGETFTGKSLDSTIAFSLDGKYLYEKQKSEDILYENGIIKSSWNTYIGQNVCLFIIPGNPWHIRIIRVNTDVPVRLYDFGFAISSDRTTKEEKKSSVFIKTFSNEVSGIVNLYGNGVEGWYNCDPNTNILYARTVVPYITWYLSSGEYLLVDAVYGGTVPIEQRPNIKIKNHHIIVQINGNESLIDIGKGAIQPQNTWLRVIKYVKVFKQRLK